MLNASQIMRLELNMQVLAPVGLDAARFRRPRRVSAEDLQMGPGHRHLPGIEDGEPDRPGNWCWPTGRPSPNGCSPTATSTISIAAGWSSTRNSWPTSAVSVAPGGLSRSQNNIAYGLLDDAAIDKALKDYVARGNTLLIVKSVDGFESAPQRHELHRLPPDAWHCRLPLYRRRSGQRAAPQRRLRAGLGACSSPTCRAGAPSSRNSPSAGIRISPAASPPVPDAEICRSPERHRPLQWLGLDLLSRRRCQLQGLDLRRRPALRRRPRKRHPSGLRHLRQRGRHGGRRPRRVRRDQDVDMGQ